MTFRADRYPVDWPAISLAIRERAGNECECTGQCGDAHEGHRCGAPNGRKIDREKHRRERWQLHACDGVCVGEGCTATKVILTVAHLDHDEQHNDASNLAALCQRCHLKLDSADNTARRRERTNAARGQLPLPMLAVMPEHRGAR